MQKSRIEILNLKLSECGTKQTKTDAEQKYWETLSESFYDLLFLNDCLLKSGGQLLPMLMKDGGASGVNSIEFPFQSDVINNKIDNKWPKPLFPQYGTVSVHSIWHFVSDFCKYL